MRFEKYLTFRGHPEGYEKSGGGFRILGRLANVISLYDNNPVGYL
ncbi:MAG: hypothetical protein NTX75_04175 [Proteobacteria bacterium]|nr:hypothetical protein [Pseudomonadota bacterium]